MKRFHIRVLFLTTLVIALVVPAALAQRRSEKGMAKYDRSKEVTLRGTVEDVNEQSGPSGMHQTSSTTSPSATERSSTRTDQPSTSPTTTPSTTTPSTTPSATPSERGSARERTAGMEREGMQGTWVTLRTSDTGQSSKSSRSRSSKSSSTSSSAGAGGTINVFLGPSDFLSSNQFTLSKGDQIEVTGAKVEHQGTEYVLAREIKKEGMTLTLRNSQGNPEWQKGSSRRSERER